MKRSYQALFDAPAAALHLRDELLGLALLADEVRGSFVILKFEREHPAAARFIRSLFSGDRAVVCERIRGRWPEVALIPGWEDFVGRLQAKLIEEWERQR